MAKQEKTNAMRILDQKKVEYVVHDYTESGAIAGEDVAKTLGEDPEKVFKTLVTVGKSKQYYVFLVPVCKELNLKKAAKAVGEKSIEMIKSKELLPLTGYIHGGCSPIGMKKAFPTTVDASAKNIDKIYFSAGKIGLQVEIAVSDINKLIKVKYDDICDL
ncbi:MAG: Cys-tRNA(Pro) deacylase [Clostridia bacterium]|nr:Cys-tRNA(Pro) deacylase [Clostridia bacterium]